MTAMLPTFMVMRQIPQKTALPLTGKLERVHLVLPIVKCPRHLLPLTHLTGAIGGALDDDVLVCFEEVLVQVPSEWDEPAMKE